MIVRFQTPCRHRPWYLWSAVLLFHSWTAPCAVAQFREQFEAPETSWQLADRDCTVQILSHARSFDGAHSGQGCEQLQIRANHGSFVHFAHIIPTSRIIDEFRAGVWIRANRPGIQVMLRVVLPRSIDPRTGQPLKTLIRGDSYQQVDTWQRLTVDRPLHRLTQQLPLLRSQFGSDISAREAYADLIVLNTYGGKGVTSISIDDMEIAGQVSVDVTSRSTRPDTAAPTDTTGPAVLSHEQSQEIQMQGSQLLLDGRPGLPRVIHYNGEPLTWLKSLGFTAIQLSEQPSAELVKEADAAEMRIVAPPDLRYLSEPSASVPPAVLAWNMGDDLNSTDYESINRSIRRLRERLGQRAPLMTCSPSTDIRRYSRIADVLLLEPPPTAGSLPLQDLGDWYLNKRRLARDGTPVWAVVSTQLSPSITQQMRAFGADLDHPISLEPEQMRLAAWHAIASGARGIIFQSDSPLNASDRLSVIRARSLERLNQELQLLEPWAATGTHQEEIESPNASFRITLLATDRSRLVLILRRQPDQQFVAGRVEPEPVTFAVHGVTETDEVYRITSEGLHRIHQDRGTGLSITLEAVDMVTPVVLTQDRLTINYLARQVAENRKQNGLLAAEIAANVYASVVETHQQLLRLEPSNGAANASLEQARAQLQHFERLIEGGGHDRASKFLSKGLQQLAITRYQMWRSVIDPFPCRVSSPLCISFFSLPHHYRLLHRLRQARWGPNTLAGGDFESLEHLQTNGWQNITRAGEAKSAVELSLHGPHKGRSSLRLQCWPADPEQPALVLDTAPVSIISGPVPVAAGQIIRIHGWLRVPEPITGSLDGLMVYDSLADRDLAHRVRQTHGWEEFSLYRAAPTDGTIRVTFSLGGYGQAWIDSVSLEVLEPAAGAMAERPTWSRP